MAEYSAFGLEVKTKLLNAKPRKTQEWLREAVNNDTGMKIDSSRMSGILSGRRTSERVVSSICKILNIPEPEQQEAFSTPQL